MSAQCSGGPRSGFEEGEATNCGKLPMLGGAELSRGLEKAVLSEVWPSPGTRVGLCGLQPGVGVASTGLGETSGTSAGDTWTGRLIGVKMRLPGRWEGLVGREKAVHGITGGSRGDVGMLELTVLEAGRELKFSA